jgi:hypothetical protein
VADFGDSKVNKNGPGGVGVVQTEEYCQNFM